MNGLKKDKIEKSENINKEKNREIILKYRRNRFKNYLAKLLLRKILKK
tara:strand:+ start:1225 stop:1368 length:144 start_codon:yes stop_codon:yes gene_type:complete